MHVANVKFYDIANGEGVRTSLFVSGCRHHCKNCFNAEAWDFTFGTPYTKKTEEEIIASLAPDYIAGLTVLGGEPFDTLSSVSGRRRYNTLDFPTENRVPTGRFRPYWKPRSQGTRSPFTIPTVLKSVPTK